jgi:hypothetical protein
VCVLHVHGVSYIIPARSDCPIVARLPFAAVKEGSACKW